MKRILIDFWVGVFILIGILCLAFLSFRVATVSGFGSVSDKYYTLHANFNNIGSLKVSAPVKVSGFIVGRVTDIHLDPHSYQAIVTMEINENYKFSADASAQVLTMGILGEQYVGIQSGADSNYLKNGQTINFTSSAMVLEELIGKFITK